MATTPNNIHRFNITALALLEYLYCVFPVPVEINASHIGIDAAPKDSDEQAYWDFGVGADHALTWLAEEGFLRFSVKGGDGNFYSVRLTLKGLTLLGHLPVALKEGGRKSPLIQGIRKVLASGAEQAGTDAVKSLIGALFRASLAVGGAGAQVVSVSA